MRRAVSWLHALAAAAVLSFVPCEAITTQAAEPGIISPHELQKLVEVAWRDAPTEIDAEVYRERITPPGAQTARVKNDMAAFYKARFDQLPADQRPSADEIQALVQQGVERELERHTGPRILKQRIRMSGPLYRVDQAMATKGISLTDDTPYDFSFVNGGDPTHQSWDNFRYFHAAKYAIRDDSRSARVRAEPINFLNSFGPIVVAMIKGATGTVVELNGVKTAVPASERIEEIIEDKHEIVRILASTEKFRGRDCIRIELIGRKENSGVVSLWVDKNDAARTYRIESSDARGNLIAAEERSDFDSEIGFPRVWTRQAFQKGKPTTSDRFVFNKMEIGKPLPRDIFEFDPPDGYAVYDNRPPKPTLVGPPELIGGGDAPLDNQSSATRYYLIGVNVLIIVFLVCIYILRRRIPLH